jgi:hypothetical protein
MAELWALLHFIMPTLFDSHDEFNEWFSKDIESHAENKTGIDESKYEGSLFHCVVMTDSVHQNVSSTMVIFRLSCLCGCLTFTGCASHYCSTMFVKRYWPSAALFSSHVFCVMAL